MTLWLQFIGLGEMSNFSLTVLIEINGVMTKAGSITGTDLWINAQSFGLYTWHTPEEASMHSVSAIELSNFAVNSAYKDKHPELNRIGHN